MSILEKRVISKNLGYILVNLEVNDLLHRLISENLITDDEEERIAKETTRQDKAKKLLSVLKCKDNWFSCFIHNVKETQAFIADILLSSQEEIVQEWTTIGEINLLNMQQSHTLVLIYPLLRTRWFKKVTRNRTQQATVLKETTNYA